MERLTEVLNSLRIAKVSFRILVILSRTDCAPHIPYEHSKLSASPSFAAQTLEAHYRPDTILVSRLDLPRESLSRKQSHEYICRWSFLQAKFA